MELDDLLKASRSVEPASQDDLRRIRVKVVMTASRQIWSGPRDMSLASIHQTHQLQGEDD